MKIESWQLSNLLKAYFQGVIQSVLHNPANKLSTGALQRCLMIQMSSTICWWVVNLTGFLCINICNEFVPFTPSYCGKLPF